MGNPKISIILPVYNVEKYLQRCIDSIKSQSFQDYEVIFVDDCSPDNSAQIIKENSAKDSRIKFVQHDRNHGLMIARKTGYDIATGDYFYFLDSDDELPIDALYCLYKKAIDSDADIICGTNVYIKNNGTKERWDCKLSYGQDRLSSFKSLLTHELRHNLCAKLYKRSLFEEGDLTANEKHISAEDLLLFTELLSRADKIVTIEDDVYLYYQNPGTASQVRFSDWQKECFIKAWKTLYDVVSQYNELNILLYRYLQRSILRFYYMGYNCDGHFEQLLKQYGLKDLISNKNILSKNSLINSCALFAAKYVGSFLYSIRHK